ncbi:DUF4832 domain-containing protein [Verrucomicrobiota bacterium]
MKSFGDNGASLVNPNMGWVFHYYNCGLHKYGAFLEPSDTLADFPGLSTIYLRLAWSYMEPREGQFDWSPLDTAIQRWRDAGFRIAFRITCCEGSVYYATPEWVRAAGAKGYHFNNGKIDPDAPNWEPDYNDPVFLEKLGRFLAVFGKRYGSLPYVDFIDVGSYGIWGECHCYWSTKIDYGPDMFMKHLKLYEQHLPDALLVVNDDLDWSVSPDIIDYAVENGYALRDDSIFCDPTDPPYYGHRLADRFWRQTPVILEMGHYVHALGNKTWQEGRNYLRAVRDYHAAYVSAHWWPRDFMAGNMEHILEMNRILGYRFRLLAADWNETIDDARFSFSATWRNDGVCCCYRDAYPCLTIKDVKGGKVQVLVDDTFKARRLEPEPYGQAASLAQAFTATLTMQMPAGDYEVFLSLGDADGTPRIALPLDDDDGFRRYRLGGVHVKNAIPLSAPPNHLESLVPIHTGERR